MTQKPVFKAKLGSVQCAVWKNRTDDDRVLHSATFEKRYKDKDGEWKATQSFNVADLANLRFLIEKAQEYAFDVTTGADA